MTEFPQPQVMSPRVSPRTLGDEHTQLLSNFENPHNVVVSRELQSVSFSFGAGDQSMSPTKEELQRQLDAQTHEVNMCWNEASSSVAAVRTEAQIRMQNVLTECRDSVLTQRMGFEEAARRYEQQAGDAMKLELAHLHLRSQQSCQALENDCQRTLEVSQQALNQERAACAEAQAQCAKARSSTGEQLAQQSAAICDNARREHDVVATNMKTAHRTQLQQIQQRNDEISQNLRVLEGSQKEKGVFLEGIPEG